MSFPSKWKARASERLGFASAGKRCAARAVPTFKESRTKNRGPALHFCVRGRPVPTFRKHLYQSCFLSDVVPAWLRHDPVPTFPEALERGDAGARHEIYKLPHRDREDPHHLLRWVPESGAHAIAAPRDDRSAGVSARSLFFESRCSSSLLIRPMVHASD